MTNHLGNVLGEVTDRKVNYTSGGSSLSYYVPDVVSVADYYPFGMRSRYSYISAYPLSFRFGFNGKENDDEIKGGGDQIDYGMRIYDPRLGRFLSIDPLQKKYPELTPYQFASNSPIQASDLDGLEGILTNRWAVGVWKWWNSSGTASTNAANGSYAAMGIPVDYTKTHSNGDAVIAAFSSGAYAYGNYMQYRAVGNPDVVEESVEVNAGLKTAFKQPQQPLEPEGTTIGSGLQKSTNITTTEVIENQAASVTNNAQALKSNFASNRPTLIQSEKDFTPTGDNIVPQAKFKSGTLITSNTRGHVKPEAYDFTNNIATEVKNFTFQLTGVNQKSISNLVEQVIQRQTHLPAGSLQHIIVDIRGQNITLMQRNHFVNQVLTRTRTPNVSIEFKSN